ncbi:hypothetical protein [Streptomyces vinaceus]|uniref:hypothetical protein n=1 Tax=Streptomyces vinaceus TaxID=1960 RepID=UPI003682EB78
MRLRNATIAALGALTLLLAVPNSASAATGEFRYQFGTGADGSLLDPESGVCINLPEASETETARAPQNLTTSTATVFLELDCDGDTYFTMPPGKKLGDRLQLRSVVFS